MPVASGGMATDVLRSVPELEVDVNGGVQLRGTAAQIYLNGRPAPMQGESLELFLQQFPADRIDRIEVIPNPSARFEAEGAGGIVNIVLKKNVDLGLSGSVFANAVQPRRGRARGGRLTYQRGRLTLFGGGFLRRSDRTHHQLRPAPEPADARPSPCWSRTRWSEREGIVRQLRPDVGVRADGAHHPARRGRRCSATAGTRTGVTRLHGDGRGDASPRSCTTAPRRTATRACPRTSPRASATALPPRRRSGASSSGSRAARAATPVPAGARADRVGPAEAARMGGGGPGGLGSAAAVGGGGAGGGSDHELSVDVEYETANGDNCEPHPAPHAGAGRRPVRAARAADAGRQRRGRARGAAARGLRAPVGRRRQPGDRLPGARAGHGRGPRAGGVRERGPDGARLQHRSPASATARPSTRCTARRRG